MSPKAVPIRSRLVRLDLDASIEPVMTNSPSPTPTQTRSGEEGRPHIAAEGPAGNIWPKAAVKLM